MRSIFSLHIKGHPLPSPHSLLLSWPRSSLPFLLYYPATYLSVYHPSSLSAPSLIQRAMTSHATNSASAVATTLDKFNPFAPHPFTDPQSRLDAQSSSTSDINNNKNNKARSSHVPTSYYDLYARAAKAATSSSEGGRGGGSYVSLEGSAGTATPPGTIPLSSAALQQARQQRNYTMTFNTNTSGSRMSNGGVNNNGPDLETRRRAQELILRAGSGSPKHDDELPVLRRKKEYILDGF